MKKLLLRSLLLVVTLLTGITSVNAETVNFDFTANEWGLPTGTTLARDKGYITVPIVKDGVSLVFKYGTASSLPYYIYDPSWGVDNPQVRVLKNNVMKVMAPEGKAITKITTSLTIYAPISSRQLRTLRANSVFAFPYFTCKDGLSARMARLFFARNSIRLLGALGTPLSFIYLCIVFRNRTPHVEAILTLRKTM